MHNKDAIMTATQVATMTEEEMMAFTKADLSTTAKAWKQNDASCNIAVSNTKPVLVKDMKLYAVKKENDEKKNDAPNLLLEAVTEHLRTSGEADGTFQFGMNKKVPVRAILHGKTWGSAKKQHIFPSLNEKMTEKTDNGLQGAWISHVHLKATDVTGANSSTGNQMRNVFANMNAGAMKITGGAGLLLQKVGGTNSNSESGLIKKADMDAFIQNLQSIMPEGFLEIGYITLDSSDDEFAEVIIYDVTQRGTPGIFKTERRAYGVNTNPNGRELLTCSYVNHMHGRGDGSQTDVHAFRTTVLRALNLIPFATRISSMNEAILPYLRLAPCPSNGNLIQAMDWDDIVSVTEMCLAANQAKTLEIKGKTLSIGEIFEARRSDFVPGSKSERAAAAAKNARGRPINKIDLKPENIKDLKKGAPLLDRFFEIACGQGRTASIMNMLANLNRVGTQCDGLPNIGWLLREMGKKASRKDSTAMRALEQLREDSVFWPFNHQNGVQSGIRTKRVTNMDGTYSKSNKHLRPTVTNIAGIGRVIALESLPLDQKSIDTKNAEFEKKNARRKQNNRNRTGGNGSKKANRQIRK